MIWSHARGRSARDIEHCACEPQPLLSPNLALEHRVELALGLLRGKCALGQRLFKRMRSLAPRKTFRIAATLLLVTCVSAASPRAAAQADQDYQDYMIGPRDVLQIRVFNQPDLSGPYTVEADGMLSFPLIGRITAGDLSVRQFEQALSERLADGYFKNPAVTVTVVEYNSRRVFIIGEVREPAAYPLTGVMSVVELLALAGGTTQSASGDAVVVRGGPKSTGPVLTADSEDASTIRVNLEALESGDLSQNVSLQHGDTIFVLRREVMYVSGEVRNPGEYPVRQGTTVLQALSLAGGSTEFAALNRMQIVRTIDGDQVEVPVQMDDLVQPGDTIMVPVRFF